MASERYIIRENHFAYSGEWFYSADYSEAGYGEIAGISRNFDDVMDKWKALELRVRDVCAINMRLCDMEGDVTDGNQFESSAIRIFWKGPGENKASCIS